ncbi:hypothetical protein F383_16567 [Gossypium arboreum]|uniref:Uncharacterized protein n=1 Tax=Gossypium arboreum TaxID=29729 RepID=A0A0B0NP06_GOSAR|nr:hypothetical protein F383_16567 [Gossypium arboreum]
MSHTWSYSETSRSQCMSQTCLALAYISRPMHIPECLTLALISMPMPCPRHGLTLAFLVWLMHVPNMSYTSSHK